jgi:hypothetical protein
MQSRRPGWTWALALVWALGCMDPPPLPGVSEGSGGESAASGEASTATSETAGTGTTRTGVDTTTPNEPPDEPALALSFSQIKRFDFSWSTAAGAERYQLLESAAAGDDYLQVGDDLLEESLSIERPLHLRLGARYVLRACNDAGCTESAPVSVAGSLSEAIGYFKASNTDTGDWFGARLALSGDGNTLAVAAHTEDSNATGIDGAQANNSASDAGAVHVFVRDAVGQWSQQAYLKASNTDAGDYFGNDVALSHDGDTLAVGAFGERSNATGIDGDQFDDAADEPGAAAGAVYVFVRDTMEQWSQQAYLKASNTGEEDLFGSSVALSASGDTLAVGAYWESSSATGPNGDETDDSLPGSGATYVFVRSTTDQWSQQAYLKASNTGAGDMFGSSVALSDDGDTLAVGAYGEESNATGPNGDQDDDSAPEAGAVYVFVRSTTNQWSQQAYLKASNTDEYDYFGYSVALSDDGNILAVGAFLEDGSATGIGGAQASNAAPESGAAYVFARSGASPWSQRAYLKASNTGAGDMFGASVALSGDGSTLAVGASAEASSATGIGGDRANESASYAGAVYLF